MPVVGCEPRIYGCWSPPQLGLLVTLLRPDLCCRGWYISDPVPVNPVCHALPGGACPVSALHQTTLSILVCSVTLQRTRARLYKLPTQITPSPWVRPAGLLEDMCMSRSFPLLILAFSEGYSAIHSQLPVGNKSPKATLLGWRSCARPGSGPVSPPGWLLLGQLGCVPAVNRPPIPGREARAPPATATQSIWSPSRGSVAIKIYMLPLQESKAY